VLKGDLVPHKPLLRRLLEQTVVILIAIPLLPALFALVLVTLRPVLLILCLLIVLVIAVRGAAGYVEQRRGRW
jgi:hypothetical protein